MCRTLSRLLLIGTLLVTGRASAHLFVLPNATEAGLTDDNPNHVAMILDTDDNSQWHTVVSGDGGQTWHLAQRADLPAKLNPLPQSGSVQYRSLVEPSIFGPDLPPVISALARSDDSGKTWTEVSPRDYLRSIVELNTKGEKKQFLAEYADRLPDDAYWFIVFAFSALLACLISAWTIPGARRWRPTLWIPSVVGFFLMGLALYALHLFWMRFLMDDQWESWPWNTTPGLRFPRWILGLLMQLTGNAWLAPISAVLCLPATPLFAMAIQSKKNGFLAWLVAWGGCAAVTLLLVIIIWGTLFGLHQYFG